MTTSDAIDSQNASIDEVVTTVIMARVTDFFGFFVYAIASALVFPEFFFPTYDPVTGTLLSFAIFSLAFFGRLVAYFAGRWIRSKIGRTGKVALALMILGTSTVAIGLLPGYNDIGWLAPTLLAVLRFTQGLGLGGAWDGITLQLQDAAPDHRRGFYAMVPQIGGPVGFCVAASMFYVLTGFLTAEEFIDYGWRFAFFAVMAVNVVSLFARLRLMSADFGSSEETVTPAPMDALLRTQWQTILASAFLPLASYALFHMVTLFPLAYTALYTERHISEILLWQLLGGGFAVCSVVASGYLADRISKRFVLGVSAFAIIGLCLTIQTLENYPEIYILLGFTLLGLAYGQATSIVPKRYPPEFRYSGTALSTNLSWLFGAAFAPLVGLFLTSTFGLWAASLYLMSGVIVSLIALSYLDARKRMDKAAA